MKDKVQNYFEGSLEEFSFDGKELVYDVIWIQWCIGHLTDVDFVGFMQRLKAALRPGGVICLKENCIQDVAFCVDHVDSCLTRSKEYYSRLFELSGLRVVREEVQQDFPDELLDVYMWALAGS